MKMSFKHCLHKLSSWFRYKLSKPAVIYLHFFKTKKNNFSQTFYSRQQRVVGTTKISNLVVVHIPVQSINLIQWSDQSKPILVQTFKSV